jgi:hypothetical protein
MKVHIIHIHYFHYVIHNILYFLLSFLHTHHSVLENVLITLYYNFPILYKLLLIKLCNTYVTKKYTHYKTRVKPYKFDTLLLLCFVNLTHYYIKCDF